MKKNIAFICPTCPTRAQMAWAWANRILGDKYNYYIVARDRKSITKNSNLSQVLKENKLSLIENHYTFDNPPQVEIDVVFQLSSLAKEEIPEIKGKKNIHVGLDNPDIIAEGKMVSEQLNIFRRINAEVKEFVLHIDHYIAQ